jgi:hypothetical protein
MENDKDDLEWDLLDEYFSEVQDALRAVNECMHCGTPLALEHQMDPISFKMVEVSECPQCGLERRKKVHSLN